MKEQYQRTELLLGRSAMEKLHDSRVCVFGVGGVGGYVVEALARSGVGALDLVDNDTVSVTDLNRQIIALQSTIGRPKVDVAAERIRDIDPDCSVRCIQHFYLPDDEAGIDFNVYDYVVDAIDTVSAKLHIAEKCTALGIPVISCMGTGNRMDPGAFEVADISKTSVCHLARVMRKELGKRGIKHLKVVFSKEMPGELPEGIRYPASNAFCPSSAGLLIASEVIRDLTAAP